MASLEVSASVVRNRITVLGFVLTLDVFAANMLAREHYPQGVYWVFLSAFVAWALSMIWAVIAIAVLLLAADYRPEGNVRGTAVLYAEILLYVSLLHALSASLGPLMFNIVNQFGRAPEIVEGKSVMGQNLRPFVSDLAWWLKALAGVAWLLLAYAAPLFLIGRKLARWRDRALPLLVWLLVLSMTFWVTAHAQYLRAQASGEQRSFARTFLRQYLPPAPPDNRGLAGD